MKEKDYGLTYNWKLKTLKKTGVANLNNVIIGTQWELKGTDADGNFAFFHGATPFRAEEVDPNNFIDYNSLTEETVLGWIKPAVTGGYWDHVNEQILKEIDSKKNPVEDVYGENLPWIPSANT
jgi:hypothetical protein